MRVISTDSACAEGGGLYRAPAPRTRAGPLALRDRSECPYPAHSPRSAERRCSFQRLLKGLGSLECTRRTETGGGYVSREETAPLSIRNREPYPRQAPLMALSRRFRGCVRTGTPTSILTKTPGAAVMSVWVHVPDRFRHSAGPGAARDAPPPGPWPPDMGAGGVHMPASVVPAAAAAGALQPHRRPPRGFRAGAFAVAPGPPPAPDPKARTGRWKAWGAYP